MHGRMQCICRCQPVAGTRHLIAVQCLHAAGLGPDEDHQHHQQVAWQPLMALPLQQLM